MESLGVFGQLGLALVLGLFVGLQRERSGDHARIAGIRTFPLITLLGAITALLAPAVGGWIVAAALLAVVASLVTGNVILLRSEAPAEAGMTTEIAALAMFGVGALLVVGDVAVATAIGAAVVLLLHAKQLLHGLAAKLGESDVRAIMQFILIAFIILPLVPDRTLDPYGAINFRVVWLMVVLVTGISLVGCIAARFLGGRTGAVATGLIGGLISSTATTVANAKRATAAPGASGAALLVILLASCVSMGRVLVELWAVAAASFWAMALPILVLLAVRLLTVGFVWLRVGRDAQGLPPDANPGDIKAALLFGGLFAAVLLISTIARHRLGESGLYAVAAISGLTDMDAITLSAGRMVTSDGLSPSTAWRAVVVALMSNTVFKAAAVAVLGPRRLAVQMAGADAVLMAASVALLAFWR